MKTKDKDKLFFYMSDLNLKKKKRYLLLLNKGACYVSYLRH